jgi:hypothetical protein
LSYTRKTITRRTPDNNTNSGALVEGEGFEPSKAEPSDLQSDPVGHLGIPPTKNPILTPLGRAVKRFFEPGMILSPKTPAGTAMSALFIKLDGVESGEPVLVRKTVTMTRRT